MPPAVFYQFSIGICCKTDGLAGHFRQMQYIKYIECGQIIATSHDLTPKGSWRREIPLFQGNPGGLNTMLCWPDWVCGIKSFICYTLPIFILDLFT